MINGNLISRIFRQLQTYWSLFYLFHNVHCGELLKKRPKNSPVYIFLYLFAPTCFDRFTRPSSGCSRLKSPICYNTMHPSKVSLTMCYAVPKLIMLCVKTIKICVKMSCISTFPLILCSLMSTSLMMVEWDDRNMQVWINENKRYNTGETGGPFFNNYWRLHTLSVSTEGERERERERLSMSALQHATYRYSSDMKIIRGDI